MYTDSPSKVDAVDSPGNDVNVNYSPSHPISPPIECIGILPIARGLPTFSKHARWADGLVAACLARGAGCLGQMLGMQMLRCRLHRWFRIALSRACLCFRRVWITQESRDAVGVAEELAPP